MSFCRSKSCEKNLATVISQKQKSKKNSEKNSKLTKPYSIMLRKNHSAKELHLEELFKAPLRRVKTNKNKELPLKTILENHEKSTFFIDVNDNNPKDMIIRESDIMFEIINKVNSKEEDSTRALRSSAQRNWGVILNVFKAINNMKNVNTKSVQSLTELDRSFSCFEQIHLNRKKHNADFIVKMNREKEGDFFNENFEEITKQIKLFEYVASGLDENLSKIVAIVKDDRMRNLYDASDNKHYFINQKNHEGITPLYAACMNGHVKVVETLLKYNADHLIKCGEPAEEESVLELAIRWGHAKLVEYLIKLEWPNEYLKSALKLSIEKKNDCITKLVKTAMAELKIKKKQKYACCFG